MQKEAGDAYRQTGEQIQPPKNFRDRFRRAFEEEQIRDLERVWYAHGNDNSPFARELVKLVDRLGDKYEVDELAGKYDFTGRTPMTVPQAIEIKEELETIDRLLKQLEEAAKNAQIGIIDLEALAEFAEPGDMDKLAQMQRQVEELLRHMAEQQGLERGKQGYQLTPKAYRHLPRPTAGKNLFAVASSRAPGGIKARSSAKGRSSCSKPSRTNSATAWRTWIFPQSLINAMLREGTDLPLRMKPDDIVIHRTRNNPKCATAVLMDMSGSMRYGGQYINVKRMGLALDGLIRREYPGDFLAVHRDVHVRQAAAWPAKLPRCCPSR